ncbi:MAG: transcriptional regulator [Thaumarchaeota archaeon]|nr:MAG: transcriptional regulator [Nitrososphaerota archaeon]
MSDSAGRRNFVEIAAQILALCREGARRTQVLYRANLSFQQLNKYTELLEARGLLRFDGGSRQYRITQLGVAFLVEYGELENASRTLSAKRTVLLQALAGGMGGS